MRAIAAPLFVAAAMPVAAQQIAPPDVAEVAMRACIRPDPDASEIVRPQGFSLATRLGRTAVYMHDAGATMRLTSRPGYFICEMRVPSAGEGYLEALLTELRPAIQERFAVSDTGDDEDGLIWSTVTARDVLVTVEITEDEEGDVSIVSSADAAPLTAPTQ